MVFLDSASTSECARWVGTGIARGVTTNATILRRTGDLAVGVAVKNILAYEPDELHVQVLSEDDGQAFDQAVQLAELDPRIRVKIPFVTSAGRYRG